MSVKRPLEICCRTGITGRVFRRCLNQPVAGLTLLAVIAVAVPAPTQAQLPSISPGTPSRINRPAAPTRVNRGLPPETPYTLGPTDRIQIDVFDVPEYSGEFVVLVDGSLNLPVIGTVNVRGLTLPQATDLISSRYARFVRRPIITLRLLAPRPVVLVVAGEVSRPGTYTVGPGGGGGPGAAASQFPTVTQAITLAGGVTLSAAVRDVQIRRRSTPGGEQVFTVNLGALLAGDLSQDVTLRDGDTIFIPTVATVDAAETRQLADASFASRDATPINVAVVGEVSRPGPYAVAGGTQGTGGATGAVTGAVTGAPGAAGGGGGDGGPPTLTKAIQVAGGITSQADIRSITIRRTTRAGEPRVISVNLWELLRVGDVNQDVLLQEGDVITIPTATALDPQEVNDLGQASFAPNTIVVNVVGEVARPGAIPVPPNTPLNQAILAAGGFNNRARRSTIELVRLNPNGSVSKRDITVDLAQGINEGGNPTLRNNDVVVVRRSTVARVGDTLETLLRPVTNFLSIFTLFDTFGGGD